MKTASGEVAMHGDPSWHAPKLNSLPRESEIPPRENFDSAPYPFAILLGATTTLLLITTIRSLWHLLS